ncbi:putative niacin/nicotinamide transporter NaiP [Phytophthora citrophthora]|uniref:Niacin/nicotinamide transporter NaiP n=1 Tax=Phytophthora citrophthora TaxID=4793 RepID=A0AAD9GJZ1_9STRA|nr:putative niacin/nicotinamide transporter NaiP [Phytophthora citrophthora]
MAAQIHRRLDSLDSHLSWFYTRLLLLTGISWAIHTAELVLFLFTRSFVGRDVGMGTRALEALGVGIFVGSAIGGPVFGHLADTRGRRPALLIAMALSLAGLALSAVATKHYHVIIARTVAGIGLGGELPAATVLVQELAPRCMRGRVVALLEAFTGVGTVVGVALAFGLAPQIGWRVTYLLLCGSGLYVAVLRLGVPESPRWLASAGRVDEALLVLEKIEQAHGMRTPYTVQCESSAVGISRIRWLFARQTLVLWSLWTVMALSAYALGTYVPTLISLWGFNIFSRWSTMVLIGLAQIFGCVFASSVLDSYSHVQVLTCFTSLAALASVLTSNGPWTGPFVIVGTCSVSALLAASWSCVLVCAPETFATGCRGRGVGYAFGCSRLGATVGSLLYPHMFNVWVMSVSAITWVFSLLLVAVVVAVALYEKQLLVCDGETEKTFDCEEEGPLLVSSSDSPHKTVMYSS